MNDFFQENKRPLLLIVLTMFLFAVVLFFLVIKPAASDVRQKQSQAAEKQTELQALKKKVANLQENIKKTDTNMSELMLRKKVPAERNLSAYITGLQKIEAGTDTAIQDITFTYDTGFEPTEEKEESPDTASQETSENKGTEQTGKQDKAETTADKTAAADPTVSNKTDEKETDPAKVSKELLAKMPEDLQAFTVSIQAQSQNLEDFFKFTEALEQQERLSIITQLTFNQPIHPDESVDQDEEDVAFTIMVTSFYYPK